MSSCWGICGAKEQQDLTTINPGNVSDKQRNGPVWSPAAAAHFNHMFLKPDVQSRPASRHVCISSKHHHAEPQANSARFGVVAKVCTCASGEADDGVCGAQGSRRRHAVEGRGLRLHPQSALHLQRGWDIWASHSKAMQAVCDATLPCKIIHFKEFCWLYLCTNVNINDAVTFKSENCYNNTALI